MPTWRKAIAALKTLTKNDLVEIKSLQKAPDGVVLTIEAVCKLVGIPPIMQNKASGFGKEPNWLETGKKHLFSKTRLLEDLESYDKDNISPDIIANIEPMINNPNFVPEKIAKSSKAANGLCMWVRAMYSYD